MKCCFVLYSASSNLVPNAHWRDLYRTRPTISQSIQVLLFYWTFLPAYYANQFYIKEVEYKRKSCPLLAFTINIYACYISYQGRETDTVIIFATKFVQIKYQSWCCSLSNGHHSQTYIDGKLIVLADYRERQRAVESLAFLYLMID